MRRNRAVDRSSVSSPIGLKHRIGLGWGLADQTISSVTNFALILFAGRWLGPSGLGVVAAGFTAYVLCLVLFRSLLSTPVVVRSGSQAEDSLRRATKSAVMATLSFAAIASLVVGLLGLIIPGDAGRGLRVFAPWIGPALVQELWRALLFRDSMRAQATLNDAIWLVAMLLSGLLVWGTRSEWMVGSCWGIGATCGAALGFIQTRSTPNVRRAWWAWWRAEIWPLGRWLALDRGVLNVGIQGSTFLLLAVLGASDVGGLRAIQSLFAPLSLLGGAISLPGLPAIERALRRSGREAWDMAARLSAVVTVLAMGYLTVALVAGTRILKLFFGPSFQSFDTLTLPVAAAQVFIAVGAGFVLLLQASQRGSSLVISAAVGSGVTLLAAWALARSDGITAAAWGLAAGPFLTCLFLLMFSWPVRYSTSHSRGPT
jgi:O-antigen/teichoic acid export membrane protein